MKKEHILHLCKDFSGQGLYKNLMLSLADLGLRQSVFVGSPESLKSNDYEKNEQLQVYFSHILNISDKVFYKNKINKLYSALTSKDIIFEQINFCHAHSFYSDGGLALKIKQKMGIDYIAAIRNTDLNAFMKYRPDLIFQAIRIANNAKAIIFLNHAYRKRFIEKLPIKNKDNIWSKSVIIPNGIDRFWLNESEISSQNQKKIRLLYVGDFSKNKNVPSVIRAAIKISKSAEVSLTIVGGKGSDEEKVTKMINDNQHICQHYGFIKSRDELKEIYRKNDILILPSFTETFGMVFIEALSQGCQLIYTHGEGITGLINDDRVALGVDPNNLTDIISSINKLYFHKDKSRELASKYSYQFDLDGLSKKYLNLYKSN